jgi:phosphate-selective porin
MAVAAALCLVAANAIHAQRSDSAQAPSPPRDWNAFESRWLSLRLAGALVVDASAFGQDGPSESLVGDVPDVGRFRFVRGILSGAINLRRPWDYLVSVDATGLYADHEPVLTVNDLALTIPVGGHGHVAVGRQKEGVTEQMMAPSRGIDFAERAAPVTVFVPTRNDGIRLWGSIPDAHGGWSAGIFNDALFNGLSLRASGYQAAGRVFYAPIVSADSNRALQFALDARWSQSKKGTLDYKTKPENNEAPNFVNTKSFAASSGLTGDAELMVVHDNLSFTAEALPTQAMSAADGTLTFFAYYAALSWRPGGEVRPYAEVDGTLGRVQMGNRRFAWEIAARFSHTNLTDGSQDGGVLNIPSLAVGIYGPSWSRVLLDYGFSRLARAGMTGRASLVTLRFQWELL